MRPRSLRVWPATHAPRSERCEGGLASMQRRVAALESLEKQLIERALSKAGGNRTEAAALLGLNRTTLVEKLRKYAA